MQLNPFTLAFVDDERGLEADFRAAHYLANRRTIRWMLAAGLVMFLGFGVLDRMVFPEAFARLWAIRYGVACPCILLTLLATGAPRFVRVWQPVLAAAIVVGGSAIIAMTVVAPPPLSHTYYSGVALVLVWNFALSRLRFLWASTVGWGLVCVYEVATTCLTTTPAQVFAANSFFFVSTNILGMVACYAMEYHARRDFWLARQLVAEKARVQESHCELAARFEELSAEREKVRVLRGLIPICSHCMRIRDDRGYWNQLEQFIREHSHAEFSHGICPECAEKHYGEYLK